jgi:hypothetical protein
MGAVCAVDPTNGPNRSDAHPVRTESHLPPSPRDYAFVAASCDVTTLATTASSQRSIFSRPSRDARSGETTVDASNSQPTHGFQLPAIAFRDSTAHQTILCCEPSTCHKKRQVYARHSAHHHQSSFSPPSRRRSAACQRRRSRHHHGICLSRCAPAGRPNIDDPYCARGRRHGEPESTDCRRTNEPSSDHHTPTTDIANRNRAIRPTNPTEAHSSRREVYSLRPGTRSRSVHKTRAIPAQPRSYQSAPPNNAKRLHSGIVQTSKTRLRCCYITAHSAPGSNGNVAAFGRRSSERHRRSLLRTRTPSTDFKPSQGARRRGSATSTAARRSTTTSSANVSRRAPAERRPTQTESSITAAMHRDNPAGHDVLGTAPTRALGYA